MAGKVKGRRLLVLLASTVLSTTGMSGFVPQSAFAQATTQTYEFNIPAKPIRQAVNDIVRVTNLDVVFQETPIASATGNSVRGVLTPQQAVAALLSGTSLSYAFTNGNTVTITDRVAAAHDEVAPAADGSLMLDTINVSGGGGSSVYGPYETAAPTNHISGENIERFRGSSPADMFRGTPGVMSGEARNGAGSIDPNIRGMQGMGRVATTIDGAENAVTIYQGYQGISNRTFVDPDFIAGVDITKGADAGSWGNAGSIAMRTLSADDIVKPGDTWGVRVKGGIGGNTSDPVAGNKAGYLFTNPLGWSDPATGYGSATPSSTGMNRPSFLSPTSGSGSIVGAYKGESFDLLAGYARRKQGNYHAGTHGPTASPVSTGPRPFCYSSGVCPPQFIYRDVVENAGLANYRGGEEVLNTQLETESWLFKLNADIGDDQTLQLGYTGFRSEAGDRIASAQAGFMNQAIQQEQTTGTSLDTFTARYGWNPADNDLIDMKANAYWTHLEQRNPIRGGRWGVTPESLGLPADYRVGSDTDMWGADVSNLSKFSFDHGNLDLTYGLSYRAEDTRGSRHTAALEGWLTPRDGIRQEVAGYVKGSYKPLEWDWLTLNAGLRYSHFWSEDRVDPYERSQITTDRVVPGYKTDAGGFSPSIGVTLEPFDGTQFYVNYSSTMRAPSIFESVSAFNSVVANDAVRPERSNNWEIGANFNRDGLLVPDDRAMLKLGYFNWDVKDYLARGIIVDPSNPNSLALNITNIDRAKFSGLELSGRYEIGGFTAELAANYFLEVEYCRTADTCDSKSLYADYATNHVQPEYSIDLTLSQKLLEDRLTVGGRISHVGPRAISHGDVTAQGAQQFIAPVLWDPYTLVDVFAEYKVSDNLTAAFRVENLFDRYYIDPLGLVSQPGPGRTFYASLTGSFGGDQKLPSFSSPFVGPSSNAIPGAVNWTGLYAGVHAGGGFAREQGTTTAFDGTADTTAATESANLNMNNGQFGFQAGYNRQLRNGIVLGLEGDWSKTWMSGKQKAVSTEGTFATAGSTQALTYYDIDWVSSVRGRLGIALGDRWMVYGTGGVALARETQSREQYQPSYSWSSETSVASIEQAEKTRVGFTLGGGAEYAINDKWSFNTSYIYSHFGRTNFDFENARSGVSTGSFDIANGRSASNALDLHAIKVGLNYRF